MSIISDLILVGVSGLDLVAACADTTSTKNKISQRIMKKQDLKFNWKRFTCVFFIGVGAIFIIFSDLIAFCAKLADLMQKPDGRFSWKRFTFVIFACVAVTFIILRTPQNTDAKEILEFNRDLKNYNAKLQIFDSNNKEVVQFSIAIADSDEKKMYGLMNLDHLQEDCGMFFSFHKSQIITMWMKNTRIALDMLFIDKNNEIATIATNAEPYSLDIISSEKEVQKVLEINAGLVEKFGIKVGQKVILNQK